MSSRASISLQGPIHIFREVLDGKICVDLQDGGPLDVIYGSHVLSERELRDLYLDLKAFFEKQKPPLEVARRLNDEQMLAFCTSAKKAMEINPDLTLLSEGKEYRVSDFVQQIETYFELRRLLL